ncbi:aminopeptidase N [Streptomyces radicis]|uniref:Aminopeptidase N n=1 Tax=Streptomyces radicis TaxID=1750517 RepID=A0A3A9WDJ7_9ACTN|nr:aminopeptidase N [Streptomyces radicis]RKN11055.1 aminopeptidase N [Streptomyces radicis]RKN25318.1 aminopeptidase N [Streptomyces radicis]
MPGENLTRDEARERARVLTVRGYEVALDLRSATGPGPAPGAGPRTFRSTTTIRFACAEPGTTTFADLLAPHVHSVTLNGASLPVDRVFDGTRVLLADLAAENELTVDAACAYSRTGEGMHHFADPEDGEVYLYTQYEPADARRVFTTFEQPDLKAPFTFRVTAPEAWTVLSNGAETGREPLGNGAATWTFAPTLPISTYITAVVAGPYHHARDHYRRELPDGTALEVPLGALCRKGLARHFDADEIFLLTKQGLDFFHDHFGYPYPFGTYDQAFVPEYNLGAMENPGLVTFREEYVFRGRTTRAAYQGRANTLLHEMAHMWFGDLVTMEWWDDLWLKESFADFMGAFSLVEATRFDEGWIAFANRRKAWAYRADQLSSTHPITADIRDLQDAKLNFDGITYAKGASVLKQLVAYVGREAFLEGARRYFKRHAYGNTRLDDLLAVLAEVSGRDMGEWAKAWLQTAGVNTLTPAATYAADGRIAELTVFQEAAQDSHPTLRPHRVAVGLYRREEPGGPVVRYARAEVDVTGPSATVPELAGYEAPLFILVNDEDLTYCKARFDETSLAGLREGLGDVADPLARALCWSALWNLTRDGLLPAREFLDLVGRFAGAEDQVGVLQMVHSWARVALLHYSAPERGDAAGAALARTALGELRRAAPGSDLQLAWARFFAGCAASDADFQLLAGLLAGSARIDGLDVDQELRWTFLLPMAAHGHAGEAEIEAELARDDTASGHRHRTRCLAARPSAEIKERAWAEVVEADRLSNALVEATIDGFAQASQRDLLAPYAPRYFDALTRVWSERTIEIAMSIVSGLYPSLGDPEPVLDATDAWLAAHGDAPPALRRLVAEARDDTARALAARHRDI